MVVVVVVAKRMILKEREIKGEAQGCNCNIPPKQAAEVSRSSNLLCSRFQCLTSYKFIWMEMFMSIRTWLLKKPKLELLGLAVGSSLVARCSLRTVACLRQVVTEGSNMTFMFWPSQLLGQWICYIVLSRNLAYFHIFSLDDLSK